MEIIIESVFKIKDLVEEVPIQFMMVLVPIAIIALATVAAVVARIVENWLPNTSH